MNINKFVIAIYILMATSPFLGGKSATLLQKPRYDVTLIIRFPDWTWAKETMIISDSNDHMFENAWLHDFKPDIEPVRLGDAVEVTPVAKTDTETVLTGHIAVRTASNGVLVKYAVKSPMDNHGGDIQIPLERPLYLAHCLTAKGDADLVITVKQF